MPPRFTAFRPVAARSCWFSTRHRFCPDRPLKALPNARVDLSRVAGARQCARRGRRALRRHRRARTMIGESGRQESWRNPSGPPDGCTKMLYRRGRADPSCLPAAVQTRRSTSLRSAECCTDEDGSDIAFDRMLYGRGRSDRHVLPVAVWTGTVEPSRLTSDCMDVDGRPRRVLPVTVWTGTVGPSRPASDCMDEAANRHVSTAILREVAVGLQSERAAFDARRVRLSGA
jgi:hypothetical protein